MINPTRLACLLPAIIACLGLLFGCTVKNYGHHYFSLKNPGMGVEPASVFFSRMKATETMRHAIYGEKKAAKLFACELFRNQLYAVALGSVPKQIQFAANRVERAYQSGETAFLKACVVEIETGLGKEFASAQPKGQ